MDNYCLFIIDYYCFKVKVKMSLNLTVEFSGGAELLFGHIKTHNVKLDLSEKKWTIKQLLLWLKDNLLQERPELFLQGDTVRPGILVLINDADWQLYDEICYVLEENDKITFISTLHGG